MRYEARVYRYILSRTHNRDDASDLTQQVFLKALDALPRYRDTGGSFAAWLFRIAHNVAMDYHRRRHYDLDWDAVPEAMRPVDAEGPEAEVLRSEAIQRMREALRELPPEKRELLALRFAAELKIAEIAQLLGKTEGAIKTDLRRCLRLLKERYDEG